MTLGEIYDLTSIDSDIDKTALDEELRNIPYLHDKYYKILSVERSLLKKYERQLKVLKFEKFDFYSNGPNETTDKSWKLPARGKILKSDVNTYVDVDKDIIELVVKIEGQTEKVEYLISYISSINFRSNLIRNIIDWTKFVNGS